MRRFQIIFLLLASNLALATSDCSNQFIGPASPIITDTSPTYYFAYAANYPGHYAIGRLFDGLLMIDIQTKTWVQGAWRYSEGFEAFDQLSKILKHFDSRVWTVAGQWDASNVGQWRGEFFEGDGVEIFNRYLKHVRSQETAHLPVFIPSQIFESGFPYDLRTNLKQFNAGVAKGLSLEKAARETWTGRSLARLGFPRVRILKTEMKGNEYVSVTVHFHSPSSKKPPSR